MSQDKLRKALSELGDEVLVFERIVAELGWAPKTVRRYMAPVERVAHLDKGQQRGGNALAFAFDKA